MKNALEIVPVSRMEEVLKHALVRQPEPIKWGEETVATAPTAAIEVDDDSVGVRAH